jgi:RND family efflux transporter MFP subunit
MNKIALTIFFLLSATLLGALDIPTQTAQIRPFGTTIDVNVKIIQQNSDQQVIASPLSGYIEVYYVRAGDRVKKGEKIAKIISAELSKMAVDYQSLKTQYAYLDKNFQSNKELYERGMLSTQEFTSKQIERDAMLSQIKGIEVTLRASNIKQESLSTTNSAHFIYATASGRISEIIQPLGSYVKEDTSIALIINKNAFFLQCYVPYRYATNVKKGQKVLIKNNASTPIYGKIERILPSIDEKTQRLSVLASIEPSSQELYLNQYVGATIYTQKDQNYLSVKKSALTFFQNEWVVFVPIQKSLSAKHKEHKEHENLTENEEHEEHDEDKESPKYEARVVEIITKDDDYVAVRGLETNESYVSDKSYYVKSMLLKSAIGEHGH